MSLSGKLPTIGTQKISIILFLDLILYSAPLHSVATKIRFMALFAKSTIDRVQPSTAVMGRLRTLQTISCHNSSLVQILRSPKQKPSALILTAVRVCRPVRVKEVSGGGECRVTDVRCRLHCYGLAHSKRVLFPGSHQLA